MSNSSKVTLLGSEYIRFLAICDGAEFYFSERLDDTAIAKALDHFPTGKVFLGFPDEPASLHDISDLRGVVDEEKIALEVAEVMDEVTQTKRDLRPPRHSNHKPKQAAYFAKALLRV